jgi:thymidylate kinase
MVKGRFVVVDGLDGVGKGVFLETFVRKAKDSGKRILDVNKYWQQHNTHPNPNDIIGKFDVVYSSEPTFAGIGKFIRSELIGKNTQRYSAQFVAHAYALDRLMLYKLLLLPVLNAGIDVYQSRSFSTSLVYQRQSALDAGEIFEIEHIMQIDGNAFCAKHPMTHLIIPTIKEAREVVARLCARKKDDDCKFENAEFQTKIKPHYEGEDLKHYFESIGTCVTYLDAGISIQESIRQAEAFYEEYLR